jgi:transposase InsO family protein
MTSYCAVAGFRTTNVPVSLSVAEARVVIEDYRLHYNQERPHGGVGYRTPDQTRLEAQALGSSRPPGSLRQELESTPIPATMNT